MYQLSLLAQKIIVKKGHISSVVVALIVLQSCANTTFKGSKSCPLPILNNDKILVLNLPFNGNFAPFEGMKKQFAKKGVHAAYIFEEEWNLKAAGIGNPSDTAYASKMMGLGYRYLLSVKGLERNSALLYNQVAGTEQYGLAEVENEDGSSRATIQFELYSLEQKRVVFATNVKTTISPFTIPSKNGKTEINISSSESASTIAMRKMAKKLMKVCK
jgi:hypothetical protein